MICPSCGHDRARLFQDGDREECAFCSMGRGGRAPHFREKICDGISASEPITMAMKRTAEDESFAERNIDKSGGVHIRPISRRAYGRVYSTPR